MVFDATCYRDVAFRSPTDGRDSSKKCYDISIPAINFELKYDVNLVMSV